MARGPRHQLRCTVCSLLFPACRSDTLYCSSACSQQAYQRRQASRALPAATSGLEVREWHGTPIQRRITDGYVNATAMCKANGKRWKDYRESDRCQHYLDALESVAGISVHALVESRSGGAGGGGTWVHPQVAVDLARWISAPFAVWMDGWFLESLTTPTVEPGITIRAETPEQARHIWLDAVWRQMVKPPQQDLTDLFQYVPG